MVVFTLSLPRTPPLGSERKQGLNRYCSPLPPPQIPPYPLPPTRMRLCHVHWQRLSSSSAIGGIRLHFCQEVSSEGLHAPFLDQPEQTSLLPVFSVSVVPEELGGREEGREDGEEDSTRGGWAFNIRADRL